MKLCFNRFLRQFALAKQNKAKQNKFNYTCCTNCNVRFGLCQEWKTGTVHTENEGMPTKEQLFNEMKRKPVHTTPHNNSRHGILFSWFYQLEHNACRKTTIEVSNAIFLDLRQLLLCVHARAHDQPPDQNHCEIIFLCIFL